MTDNPAPVSRDAVIDRYSGLARTALAGCLNGTLTRRPPLRISAAIPGSGSPGGGPG